jgi:hypothetical protein
MIIKLYDKHKEKYTLADKKYVIQACSSHTSITGQREEIPSIGAHIDQFGCAGPNRDYEDINMKNKKKVNKRSMKLRNWTRKKRLERKSHNRTSCSFLFFLSF